MLNRPTFGGHITCGREVFVLRNSLATCTLSAGYSGWDECGKSDKFVGPATPPHFLRPIEGILVAGELQEVENFIYHPKKLIFVGTET